MKPEYKIVKIRCTNCGGGQTNHLILREHKTSFDDENISGGGTYQICQCQGCEYIRFRQSSWNSEDWYHDDEGDIIHNELVLIFPNEQEIKHHSKFEYAFELPEKIEAIYSETIKAINFDANILAGGGLRAIVEAICTEKAVAGSNLVDKINNLKKNDFLTQAQADLLHEERYIGNKALHEISAPSSSDLRDGLDIIEAMLKTIYILPEKAARLKKRREKNNTK